MGTIIRTTAIYSEKNPISSVKCSCKAIEHCIASAGIDKVDIDLIINTGIYREKNIAEPAMATLIQKESGVNLDPILKFEGNSTFSFDLKNGPVGILYAIQVADAMLRTGKIRNALIVSNDVHPSTEHIPDFPFTQVGSAMLLEQSDNRNKGFTKLMFKTSDSTHAGFNSYLDIFQAGHEGRNIVTVKKDKDYINDLLEFTVRTVGEFIGEYADNGSAVNHIICTLPVKTFGRDLAKRLGIPEERVVSPYEEYGDPHTSSLAVAYHIVRHKGILSQGEKILFIGAGAGLTCACGLYCI
jgi:3-oxoacyl-[acyl-carrier-protein] synthase-3